MTLYFPVPARTTAECNLFLRAAWSQIRLEFGKLAWQFAPSRHGARNTIYFGWADVGIPPSIRFGVTYKERGVAQDIIAESAEPTTERRIRQAMTTAQALLAAPNTLDFLVPIRSSLAIPFRRQDGARVQVRPAASDAFFIQLQRVRVFDEFDAASECQRRVRMLLDALAFMTNLSFEALAPEAIEEPPICTPEDAARPPDDWIDGHPVVDGRIALSRAQIELLDALCEDLSEPLIHLVDAAHHFHAGLQIETQRHGESTLGQIATEHAIVSYLSCLEVASLIGSAKPQQCSECGQARYRISGRVVDFVTEHVGGSAPNLAKLLYQTRSSYLHNGLLLSSRSYTGATIPQLDPSTPTGVSSPQSVAPVLNLREYTSFALRALVRAGVA